MIKEKRKPATRKLTTTALLSAICIIMSLTPLGYIPTPFLKITLLHIPVIIAGIVEGPVVGVFVGFVFGVTSLIKNLSNPTPLSFVFYNPLVSVLPRVLIGLMSYYAFKYTKKITQNYSLGFILSAVIGTMTNTVGVLGSIYLLYAKEYMDALSVSGGNSSGLPIEKILLATIATNMVPEILAASFITVAVCTGLYKALKIK